MSSLQSIRNSRLKLFHRVFPLMGDGDPEDDGWQRVELLTPCVAYPYRNDALTGTHQIATADGGWLHELQILYSPENPHTSSAGYPQSTFKGLSSGPQGLVYFWEPGEWWIRCGCFSSKGVGFGGQIPFVFMPCPSEISKQGLVFSRVSTGRGPITVRQGLPQDQVRTVVSIQELLDGVRAIMITTGLNSNEIRLRWAGDPTAPGPYFTLYQNQILMFSGEALPLADLYGLNTAVGTKIVERTYYY